MPSLLLPFLTGLLATLTSSSSASLAMPAPPRVVLFILADDIGWNDVSYHRNTSGNSSRIESHTPSIDALATSPGSSALSHCYAHFVCTPSRCALLSGRLPIHVQSGSAFPESPNAGIPRHMTSLGGKFTRAGYTATAIGKWDAGMSTPSHVPEGRGFGGRNLVSFEHMNERWTQRIFGGGTACTLVDGNITDLWDSGAPGRALAGSQHFELLARQRALEVIAGMNDTAAPPAFIYYASPMAHYPLQVPPQYLDAYAWMSDDEAGCNASTPYIYPGPDAPPPSQFRCRQIKSAMVSMLDETVGDLEAGLRAAGVWNDTLLIFMSDNGSPLDMSEAGGNNWPARGGKYTSFDGGMRVPAFLAGGWWAARGAPAVIDAPLHIADWWSTLCAIIGVPDDDPIAAAAGLPPPDSVNLWPLLTGQNATSPRAEWAISTESYVAWPYKLVTGYSEFGTWTGPVFPNASSTDASINYIIDCGAGCVFNLEDDPWEYVDLATTLPNVTAMLQSKLAAAVPSFYSNNDTGVDACPPGTLLCGCWAAVNTWGGFLGPYQV